MAIPTITNINPASGPTKGTNLIQIEGTNFRIPPVPAAGVFQDGQPAQQTVSVEFEGVRSEWAHAVTDSLIFVRVPEWRGPPSATMPVALDVRVANLDDSGVEIPGENATEVDGYSVNRPAFTEEAHVMTVIGALIDLFRRHVIPNVWITISAEYDDTYSDGLDIVKQAEVPLIHLVGPAGPENRFYSLNRDDDEEDPTDPHQWLRKKEPVTVDLDFDIVGWADNATHLYSMAQALTLLLRDHKWLTVPLDPSNPSGPTKKYELDPGKDFGGQPDYDTPPAVDNLRNFRASCTIRGVDINEKDGLVILRGFTTYQGEGYDMSVDQTGEP